jgi:glycosyltransferase involved in cell wall biosynthesis
MENKRLKILIVAHEFSPDQGSECAVGWNIITRLVKYHDITVIYSSKYTLHLSNYFQKSGEIPGLNCVNLDRPFISKIFIALNSLFRGLGPIGLPVIHYLGYKFWQISAYRTAKRLHQTNRFDAAHQLTQISFREPGYLWKLGIPFFWGPTGGTSTLPKQFYSIISRQSRFLERIRSLSNYYQFNYYSRVREANKRAAVIYTYAHEDEFLLKKSAGGIVKIMLDVGTYPYIKKSPVPADDKPILKGIWCGQLSYRKALSILLKALSLNEITKENIEFKIIGSGPLENSMHKMADQLGLRNIEWINNVKHEEIFGLMEQADIFVHTSLREAVSSVIPEALSMGLPVICHDVNGMSIAIDETCGIKIPFISPKVSIQGFQDAIRTLILDRELLNQLKLGTFQRSQEISWDVMAETMAKDYLSIVRKSID